MNPDHMARHRAAFASLSPELRPLFQSCGTDDDGTRWACMSDDGGVTRLYIDDSENDGQGRGFAYLRKVSASDVLLRLDLARQWRCPRSDWPAPEVDPGALLPGGSSGGMGQHLPQHETWRGS